MPEIKNNFVQGKMNKDLDERLIPNGQYRDAMNVEVSTSEGSNVGVVQNILGNYRVEDIVGSGFTCVGAIADEKTNKLYWFISKYGKDAIIEYDVENSTPENPIFKPVLVDLYAGTYKGVLKFTGNIITGINIINNLLFWTDNQGEPKKINIDECKKGTANIDTHTQLVFDNGSFSGMTIKVVAKHDGALPTHPSTFPATYWPPITPVDEMINEGLYFWYQRSQMAKILGLDFDDIIDDDGYWINGWYHTDGETGNPYGDEISHPGDHNIYYVKHYRDNKFLGIKQIRVFDNANGTHARVDPTPNGPIPDVYEPQSNVDWRVGDVIFGNNVNLDIEERHITVIRPNPLTAPSVKINYIDNVSGPIDTPNLFETKFPRFSYRYKYRDGEYSAFAPFTEPVFNPKYPKDITATGVTQTTSQPQSNPSPNIFHTKDTVYSIEEPHNKAMVNSIHSIDLGDFINAKTPENVIEVDILYKQEESNVIYSIDTIKHSDPDWHAWSNNEGANIGFGKQIITESLENSQDYHGHYIGHTYAANGGSTKGKYVVTTENIYAALPANQLLRPWDNVPKKALAQEITGNRIVYGNYVQNYDLLENVKVSIGYQDRKSSIDDFESQGLPSIKSQRNYQVGVIYCDEFGRETPVFTSKNGAVNIPWQDSSGNKNASKTLQLNTSNVANFPEWVDSLKFFIKETSNPYYNLAMDRAWVTKSTYDLDDSEGHIWMSFPSSDRNKITEDDYIILKKKIGTGEEQVTFENKYKVIDIQNEAPEALKYQLVNLGVAPNTRVQGGVTGQGNLTNTGSVTDSVFYQFDYRPDKQTNKLRISQDGWHNDFGLDTDLRMQLNEEQNIGGVVPLLKDLYVSWRKLDDLLLSYLTGDSTGVASKKYKVIGGRADVDSYVLNLEKKITKKDADIAHIFNESSQTTQPTSGVHAAGGSDPRNPEYLHEGLFFQIERREPKEEEEFSGKFFVKISKNQITDLVESGNIVDITKQYQVSAKTPSFAWIDVVGSTVAVEENNFGLINWNGPATGNNTVATPENHIHGPDNNTIGNTAANPSQSSGGLLYLSNYAEAWSGIQSSMSNEGLPKATFFIDMMHMAAGQSDVSDYAKYCCVTWSGTTENNSDGLVEDSAWSYPPLKTWITDFDDISNLLYHGYLEWPDPVAYGGNLISTSPIMQSSLDYEQLPVDGWVGPLQNVNRDWYQTPPLLAPLLAGINDANGVNGLEGLITTKQIHVTGPRRWFSGMTGTSTGVGVDTKTYSPDGEVGKHFMHLSFFAPGKDLRSKDWGGLAHDANGNDAGAIYGDGSWMQNLQGIWGGGVFTGKSIQQTFGGGHQHLPMEGNYNDTGDSFLPEPPGPGVGQGYDISFEELHERQWDPTFNDSGDPDNEIRDFIRKIHPGSRFRFNRTDTLESDLQPITDNAVYTIKSVKIKKLYNHTSWRTPYNRFVKYPVSGIPGYFNVENEHVAYQSVEEVALRWLDKVDASGYFNGTTTEVDNLKNKIEDFGASHNRRLCYIIELDKNPADSTSAMGNPLSTDDMMNADFKNHNYTYIEFLDPVKDYLLSDLNKFPAIWEVDPKKKEVDLDIYYEASDNIPVKLNDRTNELFAPIGCKVEVLNSTVGGTCIVESWDGSTATLYPGLPKDDGAGIEINYTGMSFRFIREDGSYTIAEASGQVLDGIVTAPNDPIPLKKTTFNFRQDVGDTISSGLNWYNCFSFGNGIESNRIRDDFNEPFITNGVKASTTIEEQYREERRKSGLIYSGIYNSNSGVNNLNQFIMAEKITKDLNPTYGSIQKLFQRRISLIAFCEDRVISITSNKDAIYNADGNPQLIASNKVLGDANPFSGDFGISKNPESFASESYRAYFTDKQRGAVIRLSKDGLTPISDAGMKDWFRDSLPEYHTLTGTFDSYKDHYNVTLSNNPNFYENLVIDSYFDEGGPDAGDPLESTFNMIKNHQPTGVPLLYLWENPFHPVLEWQNRANAFNCHPFTQDDYNFVGSAKVCHHAEIPYGAIQPYVDGTGTAPPPPGPVATTAFLGADGLTDNGWWYDPRFSEPNTAMTSGSDIFGSAAGSDLDKQVDSTIERTIEGPDGAVTITEGSFPNTNASGVKWFDYPYGYDAIYTTDYYPYPPMGWGSSWSAAVEKTIGTPSGGFNGWPDGYYYTSTVGDKPTHVRENSSAITRNYNSHGIVFDRARKGSYIEFKNIGGGSGNTNLFDAYNSNTGSTIAHRAFFNGEELHIQLDLSIFATELDNVSGVATAIYGYNYIKPRIRIYDGNSLVPSNKLVVTNVHDATMGNDTEYTAWKTIPGYGGPMSVGEMNTVSGMHPLAPDDDYGDPSTLAGNHLNADQQLIYHPQMNNYTATQGSATVNFPSTQNISTMTGTGSGNLYAMNSSDQKLVIGCSFKFRDPGQQNLDGSAISGTYSDITPVEVISDLRIRVDQTHSHYSGSDPEYDNMEYEYVSSDPRQTSTAADYPMKRALWEINSIRCKKGIGVAGGSGGSPPPPPPPPPPPGTTDYEVDAVPPFDVPAWTEVIHAGEFGFAGIGGGGSNEWKFKKDNNYPTNHIGYSYQHTTDSLGGNYTYVEQSGMMQNDDPTLAPVETVYYMVPWDWGFGSSDSSDQDGNAFTYTSLIDPIAGNIDYLSATLGAPFTSPWESSPNHLGRPGFEFDRVAKGDNNYSYNTVTIDPNNYTYIKTLDVGAGYKDHQVISHDGFTSIDAWKGGDWYLVDIEWDKSFGVFGGWGIGGQGDVFVVGVTGTNASAGVDGQPVDIINGIGTYGQNLTMADGSIHKQLIRLKQADRFRYGTQEKVMRAIFKVDPNANVLQGGALAGNQTLEILITNQSPAVKIEKIIVKKLSGNYIWDQWQTTNGNATDWIDNGGTYASQGIQPHANPVHAFDVQYLYYYNNSLCWQIEDLPPGNNPWQGGADVYDWTQLFTPSPWISPSTWTLSFTVNDNAYGVIDQNPTASGVFTGSFRGFASTSNPAALALGNAPDGYEGVSFEGVDQPGHYQISFNFDGSNSLSSWTFERAPLGSSTFVAHSGALTTVSSSFPVGNLPSYMTASDMMDRIKFYPEEVYTSHEYSISNIILTDNTPIFIGGGAAGGWNFNGFNTSLYNFVYWDYENQHLTFLACPVALEDDDTVFQEFISVSQPIDATINRYEKYKISFTHGITANSTATLSIYYYNSLGFGFKISNISNTTAGYIPIDPLTGLVDYTNYPNVAPFELIVTIGDPDYIDYPPTALSGYSIGPSSWSSINQLDSAFNPDLKNSFVIQVEGSLDDNDILFGYIDNVSMVRVFDMTDAVDTTVSFSEKVNGWTSFKGFIPENGVNVSNKYFTFDKGALYQHYVPLVDGNNGETDDNTGEFTAYTLEEANNYNTFYDNFIQPSTVTAVLNQEPSTVKMFNTINYEGTQSYIVQPSNANRITLNNVAAWKAGADIVGWWCSSIITDLDNGSVNEFIEKEGKWFNYIKGINNKSNDTSLFSAQGVGIIDSVILLEGEEGASRTAGFPVTSLPAKPITPPGTTNNY